MKNIERVQLANEERLKELAEYQRAVETAEGQKVMAHLRKICGADRSCFRPGDDSGTAFACGLRDAYLLMIRDTEIDVSELAEKLKLKEDRNV